MSDDDLIRDAVHEMVAAAPPPKPLPTGGVAPGRSPYRWMAVAAAAILVVTGIAAIAWLRADDDATPPVATTVPAPTPTPPPGSVVTSTPPPTSAVTVTGPPSTGPVTVESSSPTTSASTTTSPTSTTTTTVPLTPEGANLQSYLEALADRRYDDAAVLLNEGGLELEARADLRPLFVEYGDIDDLAARLGSWCENEAICTLPDAPPVDIGGYWFATWTTSGGPVAAYFRSGSFEGSPSVGGLPPRRPPGAVIVCPNADVEAVREADLDGDGAPETIVINLVRVSGSADSMSACNTALAATVDLATDGPLAAGVLDPEGGGAATLLVGSAQATSTCGSTYALDDEGALAVTGWSNCWGDTGISIGCGRDVAGEPAIVEYRYSFVGGDRLDNSTAMDVDVLALDGTPLDSFSLTLPDQIEEGLRIVEPSCNGLPVITYG